MSSSALAASALVMGLAGSAHCATMCGAVCAALTGGVSSGRVAADGAAVTGGAAGARVVWMATSGAVAESTAARVAALLAGRFASYAAAGAVVAASVSALASIGASTAPLRPFWAMLHVAAIALGAWLLLRGRQPAWMQDLGQRLSRWGGAGRGVGAGPTLRRAGAAGLLWAAWPCGLLQSALVVAALAPDAAGGAFVMAAFALGSGVGLVAGPAVWRGLSKAGTWGSAQAVTRLAGAMLVGASSWALWHLLWVATDPLTCRA